MSALVWLKRIPTAPLPFLSLRGLIIPVGVFCFATLNEIQ